MMRYWFILFLVSPWMLCAQKFVAADLTQLKTYSTGVFSNDAQVKAETQGTVSTLEVQRIWQKRKDGIWLFTERTDTAHVYGVWHFYLQDDTTAVMQFLDFKEQEKAMQLSKDIKQETSLYITSLFTRRGCEIYLKKNKTGYTGTSTGKDCMADKAGAEYLSTSINLTKNVVTLEKHFFDKDDKQVKEEVDKFTRQLNKTLK